MLGEELLDPDGVESSEVRVPGLGLLPIATRFRREKTTAQVRGRLAAPSLLGAPGTGLSGYEIHMGAVEVRGGAAHAIELTERDGAPCLAPDGAVAPGGAVVGTLVHGLFEEPPLRAALLAALRARRGLAAPDGPALPSREAEYDRLAGAVLEGLDWPLLCRIIGVAPPRPSLGSAP
jgi:adenosylcobyric acid synthase